MNAILVRFARERLMHDAVTRSALPDLGQVDYGAGPSVLVFSDDAARRNWIAAAVTAAGGRISTALPLGEAVGRIADHAAPYGVIVDFEAGEAVVAEDLLDTVEHAARSHHFRSIALIGADMIDVAAARAGHGDVQLICGSDDRILAAGIETLLTPRPIELLNDIGGDSGIVGLRQLSEEVSRIARMLATFSERQRANADGAPEEAVIDAATIRAMIRARRMREQYFPAELFADPAWDMLLDLTAAGLEGRPVAVSSLCIAAAVPPTTALRWIKTLTDLGMFVRVSDPSDRRRVFIGLSDEVAAGMQACLAATRHAAGMII
jgi:hypothetical protein